MQEVCGDALMARVWVGQGLLPMDGPEQLLQLRAVLQGVWQSQGNVCQTNGCEVVMYPGVAMLQVFIKVHDIDHQGILRSWECHQVVLVAETLECPLLTPVNPTHVVL